MKQIFAILLLMIIQPAEAAHQSRYFIVSVDHYEIHPKESLMLLYLEDTPVKVMYDRPSTELENKTFSDIAQYIQKDKVNLTLIINNKPLDFVAEHSDYDPQTRKLTLKVHINKSLGFKELHGEAITGNKTILITGGIIE